MHPDSLPPRRASPVARARAAVARTATDLRDRTSRTARELTARLLPRPELSRGLVSLARLLDPSCPVPAPAPLPQAEPAPAPEAGPARRSRGVPPSPCHDVRARPVRLRIQEGCLRRLLADLAVHRLGPGGADETGWVPVGEVAADGALVVRGLIPAGPRARATPAALEIDQPFVLAALHLLRSRGPAHVLGLIHSHPGGMDWNSGTDLRTDRDHVTTLRGGVGLYPIVVHEPIRSGRRTRVGAAITWWAMTAERPSVYVRARAEVVPGPDAAGWLGDHAPALEAMADLVLAAREEGLRVELRPAGDRSGGLDLVLRSGGQAALRRYDPAGGPVLLGGPDGPRRLARPAAHPDDLARQLARLLGELDHEDGARSRPHLAGRGHGAPHRAPGEDD